MKITFLYKRMRYLTIAEVLQFGFKKCSVDALARVEGRDVRIYLGRNGPQSAGKPCVYLSGKAQAVNNDKHASDEERKKNSFCRSVADV